MEREALSLEDRLTYGSRQYYRQLKEKSHGAFVCTSFLIQNRESLKLFQKSDITEEELHLLVDKMEYPTYLDEVDSKDLTE